MGSEPPIPDGAGPAPATGAPVGPRRSAPVEATTSSDVRSSGRFDGGFDGGIDAGFDAADEIAPVDRQADPSHWLPGRALLIVGAVAALALIITVVVCLLVWTTAPMQPLRVPVVGRG
jgi:hypothetical protein